MVSLINKKTNILHNVYFHTYVSNEFYFFQFTGTEKWKCKPPYIPPLDCTDKFMNNSCLLLLDKTIFGKVDKLIIFIKTGYFCQI